MNTAKTSSPVLRWGQGSTTLVFLHYFGGAAISWKWVAEAIAPEVCCIAIDLPGFGSAPPLQSPSLRAYADYVISTLQEQGIDQFVLVGHSMGGKIALQIAADQPDGLQQVVLIAPSPPTQEPMPDDERQRMLCNHPSRDNAATTIQQASHTSLPEQQQSVGIQTHIMADDLAWRWWLLEGMNHAIADQMTQIKVPLTVVASADDPVIPIATIYQEVMAYLPPALLLQTSGVGHLMPLECPEWIAEVLTDLVHQGPR
jgi:pimeloyl-ACP methyl ester carboxylesterase